MMNRRNNYKYRKLPFVIGTLFIVAAAALYAENKYADYVAGKHSESLVRELHAEVKDTENNVGLLFGDIGKESYTPDYILNPDMEMPLIEIDGNLYVGTIRFPVLGIELPVMRSWSYQRLKIAPCLYSGSIYNGNAVIAAHNYMSHFGRLTELEQGDVVIFTDSDGNSFNYYVVVQEELLPTAVDEMIDSDADLSLFTCTASGTSRFTVRCKMVETIN